MPLDAVGFLNQKGPTFTQLEGNFERKVPLQKREGAEGATVWQDSAAGTEVRRRLALSPKLAQALPGEKPLSSVRTKTGKTTAAIPSSCLSANAAAVHQTSEAEAARVWRRVLTVCLESGGQGRHRNGGARRRRLFAPRVRAVE